MPDGWIQVLWDLRIWRSVEAVCSKELVSHASTHSRLLWKPLDSRTSLWLTLHLCFCPSWKQFRSGEFPSIENGVVVGSPTDVGESVRIQCNPGYKLQGNNTVPCQPDCTFSVNADTMPVCRPIACREASQANTEAVEAGMMYGQSRQVPCNVGFKAKSSPVSFYNPCSTSVTAKCEVTGEVSFSDECVPIVCAPFDQTHVSLRCTNETCAKLNEIISVMEPPTPIPYGETVQKRCFPGYELDPQPVTDEGHPASSAARCSATCQYTENHRQCLPAKCSGFNPPSGAIPSESEAVHKGKISVRLRFRVSVCWLVIATFPRWFDVWFFREYVHACSV
jgi:hypothetical protein